MFLFGIIGVVGFTFVSKRKWAEWIQELNETYESLNNDFMKKSTTKKLKYYVLIFYLESYDIVFRRDIYYKTKTEQRRLLMSNSIKLAIQDHGSEPVLRQSSSWCLIFFLWLKHNKMYRFYLCFTFSSWIHSAHFRLDTKVNPTIPMIPKRKT